MARGASVTQIVSAPAAAGAPGKHAHLVHAVAIDPKGYVIRVLCGRIKPEHILDDSTLYDRDPITCAVCERRLKRLKNPRGSVATDRATRLYRALRDREPQRIRRLRQTTFPSAMAVMGYLAKIEYDTTQRIGGKYQSVRRFHTFAPSSRAMLCSDGKGLYIIGGHFRVTSRGIVDIRSNGREER